MGKSPTARTLETFRELGFTAEVVERRVPHSFRTKDYAGCIDIIAFREGVGIVGIQATSGGNHAARRNKSLAEPRLLDWLKAGGRFEIVSWAKRPLGGVRGARKVWSVKREELTLGDFQ